MIILLVWLFRLRVLTTSWASWNKWRFRLRQNFFSDCSDDFFYYFFSKTKKVKIFPSSAYLLLFLSLYHFYFTSLLWCGKQFFFIFFEKADEPAKCNYQKRHFFEKQIKSSKKRNLKRGETFWIMHFILLRLVNWSTLYMNSQIGPHAAINFGQNEFEKSSCMLHNLRSEFLKK